jgi:hypothetical protein
MSDLTFNPHFTPPRQPVPAAQRHASPGRNAWMVWTLAVVMALSLTGYPIAGGLSQYFGLESTYTSYPYRAIVIGLSLNAIALAFTVGNTSMGQFRLPVPIFAFLILYMGRLLWDYSFSTIPNVERDLMFFVAAVLIPTVAMGACYTHYEERAAAIGLLAVGVTACILILLNQSVLSALSSAVDSSGRLGFESLNPISISYAGSYTMIAAYVVGQTMRWQYRVAFTFPVVGLGFMTFLAGGSRGPLVSLAVFLMLASLVNRRARVPLILGILLMVILFYVFGEDLALFQRFLAITNDLSVWERLYVQQASIEQAIENPVFGNAYLELTTLSYPHNILIESGMALGILGFGLMFVLQVKLLYDSYNLLKNGHFLLPFIVVAALVNAWISGSIFGAVDFFVGGCLVWLMLDQQKKFSASATSRGTI